ncbi:hypothetical protein MRX96_006399 [Rhipicephalus microplus]
MLRFLSEGERGRCVHDVVHPQMRTMQPATATKASQALAGRTSDAEATAATGTSGGERLLEEIVGTESKGERGHG